MSTHNICFYGETEKIIPELSANTPPNMSSALRGKNRQKAFLYQINELYHMKQGLIKHL